MEFLKRTWAQIDLNALCDNLAVIRRTVPEKAKLIAVVKADAYGHGDQVVAGELEACGVDAFAVSNIEEALHIRACGTALPILILGVTPTRYAAVLSKNRIVQTVFSADYARALSEAAHSYGVTVDCHIKVDSGMGRIGFDCLNDPDGAVAEIAACLDLPGLRFGGIFTHFAVADTDDVSFTNQQATAFLHTVDRLCAQGNTFQTVHCSNSAAAMSRPDLCKDAVRVGLVMYGLAPSPLFQNLPLKPVMQLKSSISQIRTHKQGSTVSYGRTCVLSRDTVVATIPVGYADGYPRSLSGRGCVLINGKRAPILGRICMDQMMVDVTDIDGVTTDTTVTLFGEDNGATLSLDELAALDQTINYELVCLIGKRVPRVYVKDGKTVSVVDCYYQNRIATDA